MQASSVELLEDLWLLREDLCEYRMKFRYADKIWFASCPFIYCLIDFSKYTTPYSLIVGMYVCFWTKTKRIASRSGVDFARGKEVEAEIPKSRLSKQRSEKLWVTFLAETSKDLEIILIIIVLSFTNRLSRTSLYLSLKTSFVYSNLFSLAKTVTIRCYIQTGKRKKNTLLKVVV